MRLLPLFCCCKGYAKGKNRSSGRGAGIICLKKGIRRPKNGKDFNNRETIQRTGRRIKSAVKARERESDEKVCKGKVCGGADGGRKTEEQNGTEARRQKGRGIQQNGQGATKARKGAEFLKGLHLRAGFGIMER